jgi:hypothetical protein
VELVTRPVEPGGAGDRERGWAARFFWSWLIVATAMSVSGNVAHALTEAPRDAVALAAGAALVPPVVLLASTHSVALLVRTRAGGFTYWCALSMTVALALCAFVLSFDALRSLAVSLGLSPTIAWLWPCAIDVAIAQATLCLLSLNRRTADECRGARSAATGSDHRTQRSRADRTPDDGARRVRDGAGGDRLAIAPPSGTARAAGDPAVVARWTPIAETLVRQGITTKDSDLVATILAQREAGVPPSTIGRAHKVHHTTIGRILAAADQLTP